MVMDYITAVYILINVNQWSALPLPDLLYSTLVVTMVLHSVSVTSLDAERQVLPFLMCAPENMFPQYMIVRKSQSVYSIVLM